MQASMRFLSLGVVVLLFILVGCGGDDTPVTAAATTEATTEVAPTIPPTESASADPVDSPADCGEIVSLAIAQVDTVCRALERNQLCYGHDRVLVELQPGTSANFTSSGDIVAKLRIFAT